MIPSSPEPTKSQGQLAYEEDVRRCPTYHDSKPRLAWADLDAHIQQSWERNPTARNYGRQGDDLAARDKWLRSLAAEGKADCPDCQGRTYIHIEGEERACPTCQPKAFEEEESERRAQDGQFGAGA